MKQEDRFFRLMHAVDDDLLEEAMQPVRRRRHVWIPLAAAACLCIAAALAAKTSGAVDHFHALAGELRDTEAALAKTDQLMAATVDYAKTRPVFDGYKAARYSKKYLAAHEAELASYRAAKVTLNNILAGAKLPKMDALKKSRRELAEKKKALYAEYRKAQEDMREAVAIKANIDHLLGATGGRENKAQER